MRSTAVKYGFSPATFSRSKDELVKSGFIELSGNDELLQFKPGKYTFSDAWKCNNVLVAENKK